MLYYLKVSALRCQVSGKEDSINLPAAIQASGWADKLKPILFIRVRAAFQGKLFPSAISDLGFLLN